MADQPVDLLPDALRVDETGDADCMHASGACERAQPSASTVVLPDCPLYEELLALASEATDESVRDRLRAAAVLALLDHKRALSEVAAMRDVLDNELTDREANSARIVERQNVLADRASATASDVGMAVAAFERAAVATAAIEDAIASLEVSVLVPSVECARLSAVHDKK